MLQPAIGAGLAAAVGVALFYFSDRDQRALSVLGFGTGTFQQLLQRPDAFSLSILIALATGKLVTTSLTVGSGGSAGLFGPALFIGGCGAAALGVRIQPLGPELAPPVQAFVLVGMAGFFSAAAKAPISTLIIVGELTGDYSLFAPALGVCVACFWMSGSATLFDSQPAATSH